MNTRLARFKTREGGMSLIEVMVAVLVLAIGLLGLAMLQTAGLRLTTDSYGRSQATYLAYDIIERMRANQAGFTAGRYDIANATAAVNAINAYQTCKASTCSCDTNACSSTTLAQYDLGRWYEQQYLLLNGARFAGEANGQRATISRTGNAVVVTLYWLEQEELKTQTWQAEFGS